MQKLQYHPIGTQLQKRCRKIDISVVRKSTRQSKSLRFPFIHRQVGISVLQNATHIWFVLIMRMLIRDDQCHRMFFPITDYSDVVGIQKFRNLSMLSLSSVKQILWFHEDKFPIVFTNNWMTPNSRPLQGTKSFKVVEEYFTIMIYYCSRFNTKNVRKIIYPRFICATEALALQFWERQ